MYYKRIKNIYYICFETIFFIYIYILFTMKPVLKEGYKHYYLLIKDFVFSVKYLQIIDKLTFLLKIFTKSKASISFTFFKSIFELKFKSV